MANVLIIDYGMGNLASVRRAFEECGASVLVSGDPSHVSQVSHVVLPGVGAFGDGMLHLQKAGWVEALHDIAQKQIPLLGICLGMQLLADSSEEQGHHKGLGIIPGAVVRLKSQTQERIPHVGWNEVYRQSHTPILGALADGTDFYFVHSFHFVPEHKQDILLTTPYCGEFVAAVGHGAIYGVQFHPEKSSWAGFDLIKNFISLC